VTYEFDLISELGELGFVDHGFERAAYLLREFQPATRVRLIGSPPSRMGVRAQGEPSEVAPGILAEVEMLAERFQIALERPVWRRSMCSSASFAIAGPDRSPGRGALDAMRVAADAEGSLAVHRPVAVTDIKSSER
jgi:hypothetical protein